MRFFETSPLPRGWKWGCALLSALGLFWSFPPSGHGLLVFVALIPLFLVKSHDRKYDEAEYRKDHEKDERPESHR